MALRVTSGSVCRHLEFKGQNKYPRKLHAFLPVTHYAAYHTKNTAAIRATYIKQGEWGEKEHLHSYLIERIPVLKRYFEHLPQTGDEVRLSERIMERFSTKIGFTYGASLPFRLNLKHPQLPPQQASPGAFSESELEFFFENGFIGPKEIPSVSHESLKTLHQRFTGMLTGSTPDQ